MGEWEGVREREERREEVGTHISCYSLGVDRWVRGGGQELSL